MTFSNGITMRQLKAENTVPCTVCGSENHEFVCYSRHPRIFSVTTPISICCDCGFIFINPRWDAEQLGQINDLWFPRKSLKPVSEPTNEKQKFRKWYVLDERVYPYYSNGTKFVEAANQIKSNGIRNVLDIGAAKGRAIEYLKRQFPELQAFAIEQQESFQRHVEMKHGGKIIAEGVEEDWEQTYENFFDLVIFRHTLEHLPNPKLVLEKIRRSLTDEGYAYIVVPSMRQVGGLLFYGHFVPYHLSYFCKETLDSLARQAGLEPVVLKEQEEGELWGMFKKGEIQTIRPNVYAEMIGIINHHKHKDRWPTLKIWYMMNLRHYLERLKLRKPLAQLRRKIKDFLSKE